MRRPLEFFVQSARSRKGLAAAALIASSLLIALAVVHNATRRTALAAVYPPFASSFGARARATMQARPRACRDREKTGCVRQGESMTRVCLQGLASDKGLYSMKSQVSVRCTGSMCVCVSVCERECVCKDIYIYIHTYIYTIPGE
jgi:hypothetical protein